MPGERAEMLRGVNNRLEELQIVMKGTEDHRTRILVAVAKNLLEWKVMIRKMKSIYETMNMFNIDVTSKCLVAECWCPDIFIPKIQEALIQAQRTSQTAIPSVLTCIDTTQTPPTLNITNKVSVNWI
jgi:V-type H+-transporting ATPase subunit a